MSLFSSLNQCYENGMPQKIGYARVSTQDQDLSLQIDALKREGCSQIYEEKVSGKSADRPELASCVKALRTGDTLVVWRMDRLGRSLRDLVEIVTSIDAKGINFTSLNEKIETGTASGKLMFHVFASMAEFERNLISERTRAGLAAARARGRVGGRKPALSGKDIEHAKLLLKNPKITVTEVAERFGVTRQTIYRQVGVVRVLGGSE